MSANCLSFAAFLIPDSDISDLLGFLTNQNITVTMFTDSDYMSAAPHSAALNVARAEKVRALQVIETFPLTLITC